MADSMFILVPIIIGTIAIFVIGSILYTVVRSVGQWSYNNAQPVLAVSATVIAKRATTNGYVHGGVHHHSRRIRTDYFVAFEMMTGERIEFLMHGSNFGLLVEGDQGILSYQGTRFKKFSVRT